ncbi:MAG: indole-3-glycerol-phosphate synthase TrpC [Candidatus Melainabacteria bacterium]|nr:MAG: indole-3-glycerol-phosphate synthase TrpC [Candidatus Melainabacteria bacterium]
MSATLAEIVAHKKVEVERRERLVSMEALHAQISLADGRFKTALAGDQIQLICEIKPKSPSAGVLRGELQLEPLVESYNRHASAISVLTDEKYFGGSIELLRRVRSLSPLPLLCKDFIIHPYQCFEARLAGADAVLLIAKILDDYQIKTLYGQIVGLGMVPAVEIQNESELETAKGLGAKLVLINNRNLDTFKIDLKTTRRLVPLLPPETIKVAASGIESYGDIDFLKDTCHNFLVGSSLMRADDVDAKLRELKGETCEVGGALSATEGAR